MNLSDFKMKTESNKLLSAQGVSAKMAANGIQTHAYPEVWYERFKKKTLHLSDFAESSELIPEILALALSNRQ